MQYLVADEGGFRFPSAFPHAQPSRPVTRIVTPQAASAPRWWSGKRPARRSGRMPGDAAPYRDRDELHRSSCRQAACPPMTLTQSPPQVLPCIAVLLAWPAWDRLAGRPIRSPPGRQNSPGPQEDGT